MRALTPTGLLLILTISLTACAGPGPKCLYPALIEYGPAFNERLADQLKKVKECCPEAYRYIGDCYKTRRQIETLRGPEAGER